MKTLKLQHVTFSENKEKSNISRYNHRANLVQKIIYFVDFCVVLIALFYPWFSSRNAARSSISNILSEHLTAHTEAITGGIQEFLKQYEIPSRFLEGITEDPYLVDCTPEKVYQFIRYCQASRNNISPKPNIFFLGESTTSFCLVNWNTTNNSTSNEKGDDYFNFYYMLTPTQDVYLLKHYNGSSTNFTDFKPYEEGDTVIDFSDKMNSIFETDEYNRFNWFNPFRNEKMVPAKTIISGATYKLKNTTDSEQNIVVSGIGLDFDYLFDSVKSVASIAECKYALLTLSGQVLITDNGKVDAKKQSSNDYLEYPKLSEISDPFWNYVETIRKKLNQTVVKEEIDGNSYLLMSESITVRDDPQFQVIVAFDLEEPTSRMYYDTSIIFIGALSIICFAYFSLSWFLRFIAIKRIKKLKRVPALEDDKFVIDENCGSLSKAIHSLRRLQLAYPEDSMLNKITDNAVLNLTQSKDALFCKPLVTNHNDSSLFDQALQPRVVPPEPKVPPFSIWKKTVGKKLSRIQPITLDFDWNFYSSNPAIIVHQIIWIVVQHDLFFEEIDPDGLVTFLTFLAKNIKHPASVSLRINSLAYLISGPLKNSLQPRIDLLAVSLAVAILQTVSEENYCKRVKSIKAVLDAFDSIVSGNGEVRTYLKETIRDLLMSADDKHVFDLIGEFSVISESSEFSINDNLDHHLIFMKSLVKFCDFCPYWSTTATMLKALEIENQLGEVSQSFRNNYEYNVASKIVAPLFNDFNNIIKMNEVASNFNTNLDKLKELCSIR